MELSSLSVSRNGSRLWLLSWDGRLFQSLLRSNEWTEVRSVSFQHENQ